MMLLQLGFPVLPGQSLRFAAMDELYRQWRYLQGLFLPSDER
jgi:hypothetical protein